MFKKLSIFHADKTRNWLTGIPIVPARYAQALAVTRKFMRLQTVNIYCADWTA